MNTGRETNGLTTIPARPMDIEAIEHELVQLWRQPQQSAEQEQPITRACMSNLIICSTPGEADVLSHEVARIVQEHPARVLLLVKEASQQTAEIEAYVSAHCHLAGGTKQICSEHITISAGTGATRRLPSTARSLLIGDLPTALWWATAEPPPLGGELFQELAAMATQVIYDSLGWPDPVRGVMATANWAVSDNSGQIGSDLAWRRLKPWKRLISQTLDPAVLPGALESISEVVLEHGPHALPQAWLLIGWAACRLGWRPAAGKMAPGTEVTWGFSTSSGPVRVTVRRLSDGDAELHSASITWRTAGGSATTRFTRTGPGRLSVEGSATLNRSLAVPSLPRAALVAQQLPDRGRDTLFRDTLVVARAMAEALSR